MRGYNEKLGLVRHEQDFLRCLGRRDAQVGSSCSPSASAAVGESLGGVGCGGGTD